MRSLLRKLLRPKPPAAHLDLGAEAEARPTSGLLLVEGTVRAAIDASVGPATLRATLAAAPDAPYEARLDLSKEPSKPWLAIHSHLLPNGSHPLELELIGRGGRVLARKKLTLRVSNLGELSARVAESLRSRGTPLIVGECDSATYDYGDATFTAWFDRAPAEADAHVRALEAAGEITAEEAAALRSFVADGYLTLPQAVDGEHVARLSAALDDAVAKRIEGYEWGASQRIHNLHNQYDAIRELWLHPKVMRMLKLIFGEPATPCQTLSYVFGSEQQYHQDTIHLTPFPAGRMCGVWTAVEDVQPDSGELIVFPGSHRAPRVYMREAGAGKVLNEDWREFGEKVAPIWKDILDAGGFPRVVYRPKAGDILIWHENLMHAGMVRRDQTRSRRSIVGHYFARGAVVYYDSSGRPGVVFEPEAA